MRAGFPALSVPCAGAKGMPVGLQLVGPFHREDLLLQVAHAYQELVNWESIYPAPVARG